MVYLRDVMDPCQESYLREMTRCYKCLEKPLKAGPQINSLEDLINELHLAFETRYVNIELVNHIMLAYKSNEDDWKKFAKFDPLKYTRNLVDKGNGKFNLILLCWGPNQGSAIHDHADSHCFMKMLNGSLTETRYCMPEDLICAKNDSTVHIGSSGEELAMKVKGTMTLNLNEVSYINDNIGVHRVENKSHTEGAVSLHLYCPPFDECAVYEPNLRKTCPVTFYSINGKIIQE